MSEDNVLKVFLIVIFFVIGCESKEERDRRYLRCNDEFIRVAGRYWELESEKLYWEGLRMRNKDRDETFYTIHIEAIEREQEKNQAERIAIRDSCKKIIYK